MADYSNNTDLLDVAVKAASAKVSPSVVSVVSRDLLPDQMKQHLGKRRRVRVSRDSECVFISSGIIIECQDDEEEKDGKFSVTIITSASIFVRTNGVDPCLVKVDVCLSNGEIYKGHVEACDFHYNLATIRIKSNSPLQTASLRSLDDILSIDPSPIQRCKKHSKFRICPGTKVIALCRSFIHPHVLKIFPGVFGVRPQTTELNCNELYWIKSADFHSADGGPVVNYSGEVIGVMFYGRAFLPINIVARWWDHYKRNREYRRPRIGVEVANLYSIRVAFLEQFAKSFPNVSTGVIVTKVEQDSPAYCSGIQPKDVIVKCDGKLVRSNLEFFETIWEKSGKCVEFDVVRISNGEELKLCMTVGDVSSDKFYQWPPRHWWII